MFCGPDGFFFARKARKDLSGLATAAATECRTPLIILRCGGGIGVGGGGGGSGGAGGADDACGVGVGEVVVTPPPPAVSTASNVIRAATALRFESWSASSSVNVRHGPAGRARPRGHAWNTLVGSTLCLSFSSRSSPFSPYLVLVVQTKNTEWSQECISVSIENRFTIND